MVKGDCESDFHSKVIISNPFLQAMNRPVEIARSSATKMVVVSARKSHTSIP